MSRKDTPHLPVRIGEIVDTARRVHEAGASIVHLHHRDEMSSGPKQAYLELVSAVRQACPELIVCVSLTGRHVSDIDARAAGLAAKPDMASLTLGSMNFPKQASVNSPDTICELASRIYAAGAIPELEVFEAGFLNYANYLTRKSVLRTPHYFNIILGSLAAAPVDLIGLGHIVSMLPKEATWAVGGIGRYQIDANILGMVAGGHVRVGLEDNLFYDRERTDLADNARLVARIARIGREMGREPASGAEAREMIGLSCQVECAA